jgi:hypothetical protein
MQFIPFRALFLRGEEKSEGESVGLIVLQRQIIIRFLRQRRKNEALNSG